MQNLCSNIKFTHLFGKITPTFTQKLLNIFIFISISTKKRTKLIDSDIYAALLLAKIAAICVFLLCKIFGPKIWSCKHLTNFKSDYIYYFYPICTAARTGHLFSSELGFDRKRRLLFFCLRIQIFRKFKSKL